MLSYSISYCWQRVYDFICRVIGEWSPKDIFIEVAERRSRSIALYVTQAAKLTRRESKPELYMAWLHHYHPLEQISLPRSAAVHGRYLAKLDAMLDACPRRVLACAACILMYIHGLTAISHGLLLITAIITDSWTICISIGDDRSCSECVHMMLSTVTQRDDDGIR